MKKMILGLFLAGASLFAADNISAQTNSRDQFDADFFGELIEMEMFEEADFYLSLFEEETSPADQHSSEEPTTPTRRKSSDKLHNKITQLMMA